MKYLILGAGPAGLSFAAKLRQLGEDSFLIIEKEKEPGGLCRSVTVDGAPFDLGGGIFLTVAVLTSISFFFNLCLRKSGIHLIESV